VSGCRYVGTEMFSTASAFENVLGWLKDAFSVEIGEGDATVVLSSNDDKAGLVLYGGGGGGTGPASVD